MDDLPNHSRRALLSGLSMALGLSACQTVVPQRHSWVYDPLDREDLVRAYTKIAGSTAERQVYLQYYGEIMAVIPGQVQKPLFRLKGLVRKRWTPNAGNAYTYSNYGHGLFLRL